MKIVILLLVTIFADVYVSGDPDIEKIRTLTGKAPMDESACQELLELLEPYEGTDNPLLFGYKGVATMISAKHVFNPFKRLSYFKKGKAMLNEAIEADPSNIELRYLRFSAQTKAPGFLGYKENLEEDKSFLITSLPQMQDRIYRNKIKNFLIESDVTSAEEKKRLRNLE